MIKRKRWCHLERGKGRAKSILLAKWSPKSAPSTATHRANSLTRLKTSCVGAKRQAKRFKFLILVSVNVRLVSKKQMQAKPPKSTPKRATKSTSRIKSMRNFTRRLSRQDVRKTTCMNRYKRPSTRKKFKFGKSRSWASSSLTPWQARILSNPKTKLTVSIARPSCHLFRRGCWVHQRRTWVN